MKKIVFMVLNGEEYGGSEKNVSDLINGLGNNYKISLFCSKDNRIVKEIKTKSNIDIYILGRGLMDFFRITVLLKKISPDIIHLHAARAIVMGRIATHLINIICKKNIKIITTVHGLYLPKSKNNNVFRKMMRFLANKDYRTITVSESDKQMLQTKFNYSSDIKVIYNGININNFSGVDVLQITHTLGFLGRLSEQKNPTIMVELAKRLPDYHILIYGTGPLETKLKKLVIEKKISNIKFMGFSKNVNLAFSTFDILISPSLFEGLPYSYIESLATGTPVICTDVGGVGEIIDNYENGILINLTTDLTIGIVEAVNNIINDYSKYSKSAKSRSAKFSIDKMVRSYKKIYDSVEINEKG